MVLLNKFKIIKEYTILNNGENFFILVDKSQFQKVSKLKKTTQLIVLDETKNFLDILKNELIQITKFFK